ncbi:hypothetical protein NFI96_008385, partial [Prochilodus magdalenae]
VELAALIQNIRLYIQHFDYSSAELRALIRKLNTITHDLETTHRNATIGSLSGGVIGAAGGITSIVGLVLAPFTLGASLIVTGVGVGVAVAGGVTGAASNITNMVRQKTFREEIDEILRTFQNKIYPMIKCLEVIEPGLEVIQRAELKDSCRQKVQAGFGIARGAGHAAELIRMVRFAEIGKVAAQVSRTVRVAGTLTGVVSGLFIALDIFFIAKDVKELLEIDEQKKDGSEKSKIVKFIQEMKNTGEHLQQTLNEFSTVVVKGGATVLVGLAFRHKLNMLTVLELLLALIMVVLSALVWRKRELTQTRNTHSCKDSSEIPKFLEGHKIKMKKKTERIFEGKKDNTTELKKVYTQLFITEGKLEEVNNEREMLKIHKDFRTKKSQDTPINCNDIFNQINKENKVVLTKGIAGIGKTVSVHKFILDWVEGGANQDIHCIFFLPFREMNLVKPGEYSLHQLLLEFHPEMEKLRETKIYEDYKLAFIFDGLDESRLPLDFDSIIVSSVKTKATVDVLITNLIRGNLLPSALIWITSRPAAANQVPSQYVSLFTEVRGFTDRQKEEYFRKRIPDKTEASKIISHIKTSRSLYIMCHIPVFCWITATVLQAMLVENQGEDIPTTLTEMYIHFLLIQMNMKNQKYEREEKRDLKKLLKDNKDVILKLAKLAFIQLTQTHIMFYEDDLTECHIDVRKDVEYSGMFAEIFKQQSVLHEEKVYCFIHLSVQEFLAALHVFSCYLLKDMDQLKLLMDECPPENVQLELLLKKTIDKATQSENGHLDLFLRFLLGISHESNQKLLQGLLGPAENTRKSISKTIQHIKQMQNKGPDLSPEISINHFFCLLELKDRSLYNQIKRYLNVEAFPERELSLSNCSALAYMLLMSEEVLEEFNPKKYNKSNDACRRLVPAVRCCRKAVLHWCNLTEESCQSVSSILELDLSNNDLQDSGAKLLSAGLENEHCKLETLRLSGCSVTAEGCSSLASALDLNPSHLTELDLSYNHPGDTGERELNTKLDDPRCKLEILRLDPKDKKFIRSGVKKSLDIKAITHNPNMASMNLLSSRLLALIKYGQWSQSDAVDLFMALMKQYENLTEPDFITQISKTLYQIEIHKINKSDLLSGTEPEPGRFVDNIEAQVNNISENTRQKTLEEILEEIRAQGTVNENILGDVKDIVSSVSLRCSSSPPSTPIQGEVLNETLLKLIQGEDLNETLLKPIQVEDLKDTLLKPTQEEDLKETLFKPIQVEDLKDTLFKPIQEEDLKDTLFKPIQVEDLKETLLKPIQVEDLKDTLFKPIQEEDLKDTLFKPIQVEDLKETLLKPIQVEDLKDTLFKPIQVEDLKDTLLKLIQVEDLKETLLKPIQEEDLKDTLLKPTQEEDLKETLFKLCTAVKKLKGWFPREAQMVSWCILVLSGSSQLVQVGTGEGKSCIVAMFAAYGAINGQSVDIISSSPVLAERDAEEWRPFYKELDITVNVNTNKRCDQALRKCYKCQVVYGTTQSFAGDWLRQRFQRKDVRPGREFQRVIVDEVDSLMLDKGLEVVYLSTEMPIMQTLNAILAEIWHTVNQKTQDTSDDKALRETLEERIKADISSAWMTQSDSQIPGFVEHINSKLGTWIENALRAKTMTLGHEYIFHEGTVVPVDYKSTGVVQNNMRWGDGLQQFLEMKHQTRLTDMSVITNFKSNVSLFKSYNQQIYGVTGTLGNQTELDMLQDLYSGIKTCQIPSFKPRKLFEEDGIVITDEDEWIQKICSVVKEQVSPAVYRGARAALVICETIKRAETIHRALTEILTAPNLKLYTNNNMDNSDVTDNTVTAGNVIIATNLAGRGTDLKVCPEVNKAGGLFVIQTFLPLNVRVENQAFGRTARQGSPGSAQLIMCSTHFSESLRLVMAIRTSPLVLLLSCLDRVTSTLLVSEPAKNEFADAIKAYKETPNIQNCETMAHALKFLLTIQEPVGPTILEEAKKARDAVVQMRLSRFLEDDIPKIIKKEKLFSDYLDLLDTIYNLDLSSNTREDMVSSLHECWAMWLLLKFKEDEPIETLRTRLKEDLQSATDKLQSKQSPSSMVYHYIRSGNRLRQQGRLQESIEMYTRAVEGPCWVAIALYNRALSTLKQRDPGYITRALTDLEKAETEVESHMKQLQRISNFVNSSNKGPNKDDSLFGKQFQAKYQVQLLFKSNIQEAVEKLQMVNNWGKNLQITEEPVRFLSKEIVYVDQVITLLSQALYLLVLNILSPLQINGLLSGTTSLLSRAASLLSRVTFLPPEVTTLLSRATSLLARATSLPPKAIPLLARATSLLARATSLPPKAIPLLARATSLLSQATPLPPEVNALLSQATSLLSQATPLPPEVNALLSQATSLLSQATPPPLEVNALLSQATSLLSLLNCFPLDIICLLLQAIVLKIQGSVEEKTTELANLKSLGLDTITLTTRPPKERG